MSIRAHAFECGRNVPLDVPLDRLRIPQSADKMMQGMMQLLHPMARGVLASHLSHDLRTRAEFERPVSLEEKAVFDRVRNWLIDRLQKLELGGLDEGRLVLNPWNKTHDLGLQSVSVGVSRLVGGAHDFQRVPALLPGEWKNPTIGVIAKGLLDRRFPQVQGMATQFGVDAEKVEELTAMSDGFPVGIARNSDVAGDFASLNAGERICVSGPDAVQLLIEKPVMSEDVGQDVKDAVYACAFLKVDH